MAQESSGRKNRQDSMTLLTDVMEHPLDPSYSQAKQHSPRHRRASRIVVGLTLVVAVVVGYGICAAVMDLRTPRPAVTQARALLGTEITQKRQIADSLERETTALRSEIAQLSNEVLHGSQIASTALSSAEVVALATAAVQGPGITVTLTDGSDEADSESARVQDSDLQLVVNELWSAGAEAIAVNGNRLGPQSSIRGAGGAVLVDLVAVMSPFTVEAIGPSNDMQVALARSQTADHLNRLNATYGIEYHVVSESVLHLPAEQITPLKVATSDELGQSVDSSSSQATLRADRRKDDE